MQRRLDLSDFHRCSSISNGFSGEVLVNTSIGVILKSWSSADLVAHGGQHGDTSVLDLCGATPLEVLHAAIG